MEPDFWPQKTSHVHGWCQPDPYSESQMMHDTNMGSQEPDAHGSGTQEPDAHGSGTHKQFVKSQTHSTSKASASCTDKGGNHATDKNDAHRCSHSRLQKCVHCKDNYLVKIPNMYDCVVDPVFAVCASGVAIFIVHRLTQPHIIQTIPACLSWICRGYTAHAIIKWGLS